MKLSNRYQSKPCLSGSILLSHPNLNDPNFSKTIVFLSAHSEDQGTLGVILNRPLGKSLGQLDEQFKGVKFSDIPVFEGGPVEKEKLIVAAWEWSVGDLPSFKLYFGIDIEKANELLDSNPETKIACFLGHSGWSPGQLEDELDSETWIVSSIDRELFENLHEKSDTWKKIVGSLSDEMKLLAYAPDKPWQN